MCRTEGLSLVEWGLQERSCLAVRFSRKVSISAFSGHPMQCPWEETMHGWQKASHSL